MATERTPLINGLDDEGILAAQREREARRLTREGPEPSQLSQAQVFTILAANWLGVFLGALDVSVWALWTQLLC